MKLILKVVFFAYVLMISSLGSAEELSGKNSAVHVPQQKELIPTEEFCGQDGLCSAEEARLASKYYMVLHHGPGVEAEVGSELDYFERKGFRAIALPGGRDNRVALYIGERLYENKQFTGSNLRHGEMTSIAMTAYNALVRPRLPEKEKKIISQVKPRKNSTITEDFCGPDGRCTSEEARLSGG